MHGFVTIVRNMHKNAFIIEIGKQITLFLLTCCYTTESRPTPTTPSALGMRLPFALNQAVRIKS